MKKTIRDPNRVGAWEKWSHFLINMGNVPVQTIIGGFLLLFYVNVCGMDPIAVATLFLITKLLDGINDPIMGYIIDHMPRRKTGRFRPYVGIGMVILSINFVLLFVGPALVDGIWKIIVAYITYILIGITFDMNDIPKNAVFIVATPNIKERNSLSIYRTAGMLIGVAIIGIIVPILVKLGRTEMEGYMIMVFTGAFIMLAFTFAGVSGIKERIEPAEENKYKVKDIIRVYSKKPMFIMLLSSLLFTANLAVTTTANAYYATYILGNFSYLALVSIMVLLGSVPGFIIFPILANKINKKTLLMAALLISAVSSIVKLMDPSNVPLYMISTIISSICLGGFITISSLIGVDNSDYIEHQMHIRVEGMSSGMGSFSAKASSALGSAIPGYVLGLTGFSATAVTQTPEALSGIIFCLTWVPFLLSAIPAALILLYPLNDKKMVGIREDLNERKALKTSQESPAGA